jgi:ubiquinone biosynthesis protein UbiJ
VPAREETNLLASELMRLVNDVDRLAARIARLQQRRSRP